ncbi:DNA polymerase IV [Pueribacillus sp. YX66]|uniref:DNA polymerase IV n=1 Tax=Pueribacillus sp. YX66 TaxID=3229242 RepID=UPI00358D74A6
MQATRKIIHVDMDAFFAAVEQRDDPKLKGKPVIVGGLPNSRGVVATCSYEARKYGIHSAMPSSIAKRKCPHAIFIKTNMEKYRAVSKQIMQIFLSFTDLVEPLALDEAYLDVTENKVGINSATLIAKQIKKRIFAETKLTASAGVSYNKFLAKVASGYQKPNGLTVVTPENADAFIDNIPIGDFFGVGKVTEEKFLQLGVKNGKDLRQLSEETLIREFQERGRTLYQNVRGVDERRVNPNRKRKSLGKETTLRENISNIHDMLPIIERLSENVSERLQAQQLVGKCIVVKVKFADFSQRTRRMTLDNYTNDKTTIFHYAEKLLHEFNLEDQSVRLLGVTTTELASAQTSRRKKANIKVYEQLKLF